jgi:ABC-type dipeptide/oligopeptide/nickel transport system ATPase subunit
MTRIFDDRPAVREKTPMFVGLIGPSGTGKTFSALRLATGIQRVSGGDIVVVDTEARRALHYADRFKYRHLAFGAPFSPLDYLAAIEHCVKKGAGTIVIDSMSHEHEGPGGVLEWHAKELDRMAGTDYAKREKMQMLAWQKPKGARRQLINAILQLNVNFIFCFRAKEKLKMVPGQAPQQRGWQPIAGEEFIYEMTVKCLLLPGANGIPTWKSDIQDEKRMIKLPEQFISTFSSAPQLTEDIGQALAAWAAGTDVPKPRTADELCADYASCSDPATLGRIESQRSIAWSKFSKDDKARVKLASEDAKERIERASRGFEDTSIGTDDDRTGDVLPDDTETTSAA